MSWLPWRLEYTKQGIEFAIKKAADAAAEAKKTAPPPEPPKAQVEVTFASPHIPRPRASDWPPASVSLRARRSKP